MITFLDSLLNHLIQNFVDAVSLVCLEYERYYLNDWVGLVTRIINKSAVLPPPQQIYNVQFDNCCNYFSD